MSKHKKYIDFKNRMIFIGFGSIGQGVLPLILRHIGIKPEQITIITADNNGVEEAKKLGIEHIVQALTQKNYRKVLEPRINKGDFIVNVSVKVSTSALIELCQEKGAHYIDTCIETWAEGYTELPLPERTCYAIRQNVLDNLKPKYKNGPTALLTEGANPGLVSHFVKQALLNIARDTKFKTKVPQTGEEWAYLAQQLGIKTIHVSERDTQISSKSKGHGEFVNTWSIHGLHDEGFIQPAELGWGTHEKEFPSSGRKHKHGSGAAIYLERPGCLTMVRSWTPLEGAIQGFLIAHNESISLAEYLTLKEGRKVTYRPTLHYAYHPCDAAVLSIHELNANQGQLQSKKRILMDDITSGMDELGVLLMGNPKGVYWFGSQLTIEQVRSLVPYNNATSLQVTVSVLAGIIWALENPNCGIIEPEEAGFQRILEIAIPYLGDVVGVWGDWTPLSDTNPWQEEKWDTSDPWQFKNILVS